jgi:hypothetical protein
MNQPELLKQKRHLAAIVVQDAIKINK